MIKEESGQQSLKVLEAEEKEVEDEGIRRSERKTRGQHKDKD
jgi:hypothetical protein